MEHMSLLPQQTNIFVIGYFGHGNTGDQQYIHSFDYVFKTFLSTYEKYNIQYLDCDQIKTKHFDDSDIIILGGGDILNNYFLDQIIAKFIN
jgi:polysaccharide pyruvyl transferase WcaK-like protein